MKFQFQKPASYTIVLFGFLISFAMSLKSFNGQEYISLSEIEPLIARDVASATPTKKVATPTNNNSSFTLIPTSPISALNSARIIHDSDSKTIQISLGNFAIKDGNSKFACNNFDKVILIYEAAYQKKSMSNSNLPTLNLEANCTINHLDILHLSPITIDLQVILKEPPSDSLLNSTGDSNFTISFSNIEDKWPSLWDIKSVQFINSNKKYPSLIINSSEISKDRKESLQMNWTLTP